MKMNKRDAQIIAVGLACFVFAGITGAFFRWGMTGGWIMGLDMANIRHAHSHLMYFSWVTPALMVLLIPEDKWTQWAAASGIVLGIVAYPLFILFGYEAGTFGPLTIPPAVVVSGLVMITWYVFTWRWVATKRFHSLLTAAVTFLVLSSCGAWAISATIPLGLVDPVWIETFKHVFLSYFTEGWLTLGTVVLLMNQSKQKLSETPNWILIFLVLGISLSYFLAMPEQLVPETAKWATRLGSAFTGVGLAWLTRKMWQGLTGWWKVPASALALKSFSLVFLAPNPSFWWAAQHNDRILFLHLILLGLVSTAILLTVLPKEEQGRWFYISVVLLLIGLLPVTSVWILPSLGMFWLSWIGPLSLLPAVVAVPLVIKLWKYQPGEEPI